MPLTRRSPNDELHEQLQQTRPDFAENQVMTVGDCHAPGLIATAVYSGYKAAREIGEAKTIDAPLRDLPLATNQQS